MQCYNCGKHFNLPHASEQHVDVGDKLQHGSGYRVSVAFCPECREFHVCLQRGFAYFDAREWIVRPEGEPEVLFPKLRRISFEDHVPESLARLLSECFSIVEVSPTGAAVLARTLLQRILRENFKVGPASLAEEIDTFLAQVPVESALREALDAVRRLGNVAAHPEIGRGEISLEEARLLVTVVEALMRIHVEAPAYHGRILKRLRDALARYNSVGRVTGTD
jgi:hypothetical protein